MPSRAIMSPYDLRRRGLWGWWDFTDLNTLFVEEDFTTPVVANLDEIGAVLDKSGNNRHLTQGTSTARALYKTAFLNGYGAAGFGSIGAGAVDDYYDISNAGVIGPSNTTIFIGSVTNTVAVKGLLGAASAGWREFFDASEVYTCGQAVTGNAWAASNATTSGTAVCLIAMTAHDRYRCDMHYASTYVTGTNVTSPGGVATERIATTVATALFGALTGPATMFDGNISEVIKCDSRIPLSWINELRRNYVMPKYALRG